ncbi:35 member B1 [Seminavis robusta]|uniref:35 member B1 n=1 Tax=Seminavis robusta TaxID=568900 RepID=A0A9N8EQB2_9STRA|nr:35 member B1 [Seminavis robusta]|eukprot:Sro1398_g269280.1 35 member B1 (383) ;mRNA; f:19271-20537
MASTNDNGGLVRLSCCALGICVCYMYYGMIQESLLSRQKIGPSFVLLIQCTTNTIVARLWQWIDQSMKASSPAAADKRIYDSMVGLHHPLLAATALCYVSAMVCSNESLHYVSYPTAVLAKSCKLIPTMAMGVLVEHKIYERMEWMAACCITMGIVLFNYSRMQGKNNDINEDSSWSGLALLSLSLLADGFLGSFQGLLKQKGYLEMPATGKKVPVRAPTATETMLFVNLYAIFFLIPLTMFNGQMEDGLAMLQGTLSSSHDPDEVGAHKTLLTGLVVLNLTVAVGQIFIFLTITWYSSLVCTTITTTRKFFTILLSVMYFGHHFTMLQWVSTGLVFCGLYLGIMGQRAKQQQQPTKKAEPMNDFSTTHFSPTRTKNGVKEE